MPFDEAPGQRQPQPGPSFPAGHERLEQPDPDLRGHARPRVVHGDAHLAVRGKGGQLDLAVPLRLGGIGEQVRENLPQPAAVSFDGRQLSNRKTHAHRERRFRGARGVLEHVAEIDPRADDGAIAGHVEEIFGEPLEPFHLVEHVLQVGCATLAQRRAGPLAQ